MNWEKIAELKVIYVQPPTGSNSVIASRKADPYDYVVSVNERRRHLSTAQRSEVAQKLPKARPDLSDRAIAKTAQVDHTTVASKRRRPEAGGEIHHPTKRTGRDGKAQSATKTNSGVDPLWPGVAQGRVRHERFWALLATVGGEAVWGSSSGVLAITRGPESKMSAALSGRRLVGGKERIKRVPCHALDRDFQIDHRGLGLLIKSDHATASGIGEGAHAAAASFAGNWQCHAGVGKAALPDGRRCGAARRQAKLPKRRAELSSRPPRSPVRVFKVLRTRSEHVPSRSRTLPKAAGKSNFS